MTRTDAEDPDFALFSILNRLSETPLRYRHINLLDILRNDLAQKIARAQRAQHSPDRFEAAYEFSDE